MPVPQKVSLEKEHAVPVSQKDNLEKDHAVPVPQKVNLEKEHAVPVSQKVNLEKEHAVPVPRKVNLEKEHFHGRTRQRRNDYIMMRKRLNKEKGKKTKKEKRKMSSTPLSTPSTSPARSVPRTVARSNTEDLIREIKMMRVEIRRSQRVVAMFRQAITAMVLSLDSAPHPAAGYFFDDLAHAEDKLARLEERHQNALDHYDFCMTVF